MKKALTLAVLLCLHTPALAAEPGPPAQLVEAIARQESGLNPLAVNIAGKSYYPATREEAERLIHVPAEGMAARRPSTPFPPGNRWYVGSLRISRPA